MRIAIIPFPDSQGEHEIMLAIKRAGMEPVEFVGNESKENLKNFAGYIMLGEISNEDSFKSVLKEQSHLGKPILGMGLGAQILIETGLVPGLENDEVGITFNADHDNTAVTVCLA